ncbi:MAG: hypothetical protein WAK55_26835 [Xanthobacteraceae bacterium]
MFGHCLRAALIVRAEGAASRCALTASIAAIEAACPDACDRARRHAVAARAWIDGDSAHAVALYGAILIDWPHDVLALAVANDFTADVTTLRLCLCQKTAKVLGLTVPPLITDAGRAADVIE